MNCISSKVVDLSKKISSKVVCIFISSVYAFICIAGK